MAIHQRMVFKTFKRHTAVYERDPKDPEPFFQSVKVTRPADRQAMWPPAVILHIDIEEEKAEEEEANNPSFAIPKDVGFRGINPEKAVQ